MDVGRAVKAPAAPFFGVIYQVSRWLLTTSLLRFKWSYMLSGRDISPSCLRYSNTCQRFRFVQLAGLVLFIEYNNLWLLRDIEPISCRWRDIEPFSCQHRDIGPLFFRYYWLKHCANGSVYYLTRHRATFLSVFYSILMLNKVFFCHRATFLSLIEPLSCRSTKK